MKLLKRIAKLILTPAWHELPMLLLLFVLLSPEVCRMVLYQIIHHNWDVYQIEGNIRLMHFAALAFLWTYIFTFIAYYSGKHKAKVKTAIYIIGFINFVTAAFVYFNFKTYISPQVLQLIAESNVSEASEFFSTFALSVGSVKTLAATVIMVALIVIGEKFYPKWCDRKKLSKAVKISCGTILSLMLAFGTYSTHIIVKMCSCKTIEQLEDCRFVNWGTIGMDGVTTLLYSFHALHLASDNVSSSRALTLNEVLHGDAQAASLDSTVNIVLIIGESYIKHHASIYGYEHETTPYLKKEMELGNLVVFNDVISPYNTTASVLKNMLSCNTREERWWKKPLLAAPLKHAGFDVFVWDNQRHQPDWATGTFTFSMETFLYDKDVIDACYKATNEQCFDYDGELVADFDNKIMKTGKLGHRNFIIFHLMGQHFELDERYPESFTHFTADSIKRKAPYITHGAKDAIAKYDNATLYNDSIIEEVFNMLRATNSVVIYVSDHGEEVYDYRDNQGRTNIDDSFSADKNAMFLKYEHQVPFVIWMSPTYRASHPEQSMQVERAVNVPFMNTDLSQMILYLAQVQTKYYNPIHNPLSPIFKPDKRIIYDKLDYDKLMNNSSKRQKALWSKGKF